MNVSNIIAELESILDTVSECKDELGAMDENMSFASLPIGQLQTAVTEFENALSEALDDLDE